MSRKTLLALLLTASGLVHAQIPISGLPNASVPLGLADQIIVNQKVTSTAYSTRQAPMSALAPFFPSLTSHYLLQSADPTLTQSRVLAGTANQVILTDGGALGNLTLSLPQSICVTCGPTFSSLTLTGLLNGFSGVFSSTLQSAGYTGTTGVFTSTLQASSLSLTTPLQATQGGTGFGSYAVGDLLTASTTTALSKLSDVAAGSYLRSGGVTTLPLWSTLTLPNAATTGDVLIATGTNAIGSLVDVTAGSYLRSNGAGVAPVYSTVKIPNTAVLGDIWYGSATNTITALTGNITTGVQFLAQTGSGAASAAPVWTTLPGSFTGFANPSGLIGLAAVNGAATTATRSDATHALDQSISPTWTGTHLFRGGLSRGGTTSQITAGLIGTIPIIGLTNSGAGVDQKSVEIVMPNNNGDFTIQNTNQAAGVTNPIFNSVRGTGTAVSTVAIGNSTDKPAITLNGATNVIAPASGDTFTLAGVNGGRGLFLNYGTGTGASNVVMQTQVPNASTSIWRISQQGITNLDLTLSATTGQFSIINGGVTGISVNPSGAVLVPGVSTTASAANAFIDNAAGNNLLRSTSSRRYKTDITTLTNATDIVMSLRPVRFHSLASADSHKNWFYGLVAEEVATVEPSLIVKDPEGRPDGVQYDRVQVFMLPVVQSMHRQIHWLWACILLLASWNVYLTLRKK